MRTRRPRFIYTMPSLHNPTDVTMNADRRERLATIARRAGVPIVEDDPYGAARAAGARRWLRSRPITSSISRRSQRRSRRACASAGWPRRARFSNGCCCANKPTTWRRASTCRRRRRLSRARLRRARRAAARRTARSAARIADEAIAQHWPRGLARRAARPADFISGRPRRASCGRARCSTRPSGWAHRFSSAKRSLPTPAATITFGSRSPP